MSKPFGYLEEVRHERKRPNFLHEDCFIVCIGKEIEFSQFSVATKALTYEKRVY